MENEPWTLLATEAGHDVHPENRAPAREQHRAGAAEGVHGLNGIWDGVGQAAREDRAEEERTCDGECQSDERARAGGGTETGQDEHETREHHAARRREERDEGHRQGAADAASQEIRAVELADPVHVPEEDGGDGKAGAEERDEETDADEPELATFPCDRGGVDGVEAVHHLQGVNRCRGDRQVAEGRARAGEATAGRDHPARR